MKIKAQKPSFFSLTPKNLDLIKSLASPFSYTVDANLFYEEQIPLVAYVFIEGQIILTKNRRKSLKVPTLSILGLTETAQGIPSLYAAKIKKGSLVYFLDRSSIFKLLDQSKDLDGELFNFLSSLEVA